VPYIETSAKNDVNVNEVPSLSPRPPFIRLRLLFSRQGDGRWTGRPARDRAPPRHRKRHQQAPLTAACAGAGVHQARERHPAAQSHAGRRPRGAARGPAPGAGRSAQDGEKERGVLRRQPEDGRAYERDTTGRRLLAAPVPASSP
jgi:hypothetical protein